MISRPRPRHPWRANPAWHRTECRRKLLRPTVASARGSDKMFWLTRAGVTQLAECGLSKPDVEGSTPFARFLHSPVHLTPVRDCYDGHDQLSVLYLIHHAVITNANSPQTRWP